MTSTRMMMMMMTVTQFYSMISFNQFQKQTPTGIIEKKLSEYTITFLINALRIVKTDNAHFITTGEFFSAYIAHTELISSYQIKAQ